MTKYKKKRINNNEPIKIFFWSLLLTIVICLISYGYFVRGAIVNIVERQKIENSLSSIRSSVIDLEVEYIKVKNSVTEEVAYDLGYIKSANQKFVTRDINNIGLSLITPGI